ncbi:MAG: PadR family transcriptional regulator [Gemmatimonadota bacterium]
MTHDPVPDLSTLEFHVLLALAAEPLYGYALKDAISTESGGMLTPRAGSLYRVVARLMGDGLVKTAEPVDAEPHPGLERKYYALTQRGHRVLAAEAQRLKHAVATAERRLNASRGS